MFQAPLLRPPPNHEDGFLVLGTEQPSYSTPSSPRSGCVHASFRRNRERCECDLSNITLAYTLGHTGDSSKFDDGVLATKPLSRGRRSS